MAHIPKKEKAPSYAGTACPEIPGYLKWKHLTGGPTDKRLPKSVSFLIRIITLTDSVISFNTAKRLTNTVEAVSKTVSHLCKTSVTEMHYREILLIFGEIYVYTPTQFKEKTTLIISVVEIENRLLYCEKKALSWVRMKYSGIDSSNTNRKLFRDIDEIMGEDEKFKCSVLGSEKVPLLYEATSDGDTDVPMQNICTSCDVVAPEVVSEKALSILEKIKKREEQRRQQFIRLEEEKEKEIFKAIHAIFSLAITSCKKSFEQEFIEKKVSIFTEKRITIEDVLKHPLTKNLIKRKETESKIKFLLLDLDKYKNTNFE